MGWGCGWSYYEEFEGEEPIRGTMWEHPRVVEKKFDLLEYERLIKESYTPRGLYHIWDEILSLYDKKVIGDYELGELKDLFYPKMEQLTGLEKQLGGGQ